MKFAEKCPKCGSSVQTKSIKKSIGLGFVHIPVAQFCLNPTCDWYQDFSEARKPEEIKEDVIQIKIPSLKDKIPALKKLQTQMPETVRKLLSKKETKKNITILGGIIVFTAILLYLLPALVHPAVKPNPTETKLPNTTLSPTVLVPTPSITMVQEHRIYPIKMDVAHGFNPKVVVINKSDIIIWNSDENQRPRVMLMSKEGLFENRRMEYSEKFSYQFNNSGNYTFVLAEFPSLKVYQNTTGNVVVK